MTASTSSERMRTNWTPNMERYFIDLMLDQMHKGNRLGHTFNKQAWTDMLTVFNAKFGCKYDRDTLKSHYTTLWKQYNVVKSLLDQNGFSWDDSHKMVIALPHIWDDYIKSLPDAQLYRNKSLMNFSDLCLIYAYTQADGRYSRSSHDIDYDDDNQGANCGNILLANQERPKTEWTSAMDHYFIELMLDQLRKGNKFTERFNALAWEDMLALFNTKFVSQFDKASLKRRFKRLSKYCSDVQRLLQQKGFSWDDTQQMITADDSIWDKYIKTHPDARTYRKKRLLNFHDLSLIFGSASNGESWGYKCHGRNDSKTVSAKTGCITRVGEESKGLSFDRVEISSIYWTPTMDRYLIDLLLDQALRGNKISHAFTPEAWSEILTGFNERFGSHLDKDVLENRSRFFRCQYNDIRNLIDQNGFFWDDTREMISAGDYVWDSYAKAQPNAQSYRQKSVPNYHKLCVIYGQESSNGLCNHLDQTVDPPPPLEDSSLMIGDDTSFHNDSPINDWTPLMDRYLIDLLLEQVRKANRMKHTLDSEAWMEMAVSFIDRFGLHFDEETLRNHHKNLEKLYNNMHILLDQRGFSWDETCQMVTACNDLWDAYIKEHPDAESYRYKSKPNYNDLCLIFGNPAYHVNGNGLEQEADYNSHGNGIFRGNGYRWITDWTPPMDRYFIDLMLEQVRQGGMVNNKFEKHAWRDMVTKFINEFGHQFNKDVLKSRFRHLRRQFIYMNSILDQIGFAWDGVRCMIVAADSLWDAYEKEHPDAQTYRDRTLPSYDDLFLIYGNANSREQLDTENDAFEEDYESPASTSSPVKIPKPEPEEGTEPDIENDALDNKFHDIFGDLQSLAAEFEISDFRKKRKPSGSSTLALPRKTRKPCQEMQEALYENSSIVETAQLVFKEDQSFSSIESIVDALQAVPGMDDELFLEASKLLEMEGNAKMFVTMDVNQRRKWLLSKLCQ